MRPFPYLVPLIILLGVAVYGTAASDEPERLETASVESRSEAASTLSEAIASLEEGQINFRYNPFGSNLFFSRTLGLNRVFEQVTPRQALALGIKVDVQQLLPRERDALARGLVDLDDPATTRLLFERFAVVGAVATFDEDGGLNDLGITCALCHSTVDDSFAPGVGNRLDGWANRDINPGAIIALSPNLQALATTLQVDVDTARAVLESWGPGRFDGHLNLDGIGFRPDGETAAVLIPPVFGMAGVNLATYVGWGSVPYWISFVAGHELNGLARFFDPRLNDAEKYPLAAAAGLGNANDMPDLTSPELANMHLYILSLKSPRPPEGSFDVEQAARGAALFTNKATCATCHVPPLFTDPGYNLHTPEEIGIDSFQADRGPTGKYRTTPLPGLWSLTRGFYHDGRFETLGEVIDHYDQHLDLELTEAEKADLAAYLLSL